MLTNGSKEPAPDVMCVDCTRTVRREKYMTVRNIRKRPRVNATEWHDNVRLGYTPEGWVPYPRVQEVGQ